ncbi:carboxypeptidase-like regulatory domain-containing protein [Puteibacter caeruleilacunae]|nr:carboxypeptidase-like regulatory domain-containing protein [Puteibacter caeruleilacunae]
MKTTSIIMLLLLVQTTLMGQVLEGRVVDSKTNEPLKYVSIGIIDSNYGTITDSDGNFRFKAKSEATSVVRISMIGYDPQKFTTQELLDIEGDIKLNASVVELPEVTITPSSEIKVGAIKPSKSSGWSGWGGQKTRRGYEIGLILDLEDKPVKVKDLNVLLKGQSFDKSLFRLHIRSIEGTKVADELLTENIILTITEESGWATMDLTPYDIVLNGKVGITLEWLEVAGNNPDRAIKINKQMTDAYILFKNSKNFCGLYRWGTEAKWKKNNKLSPSMYLTVLE